MMGRLAAFLAGKKSSCAGNARKGFTIVEFSLATALLAVLLITVMVIVMNIIDIYKKGMTIKTVNSVGRSLVDDINGSIEQAGAVLVGDATDEKKLYWREQDLTRGKYQAFCTGSYTYIWNTRDALLYNNGNNAKKATYTGSGGEKAFRMLKMKDADRNICRRWDENTAGGYKGFKHADTNSLSGYTVEEMLTDADITLYVYDFQLADRKVDQWGERAFYTGSITLGSDREKDTVLTANNCVNAKDNDEYCAVNTFKFAARTAGKGN